MVVSGCWFKGLRLSLHRMVDEGMLLRWPRRSKARKSNLSRTIHGNAKHCERRRACMLASSICRPRSLLLTTSQR